MNVVSISATLRRLLTAFFLIGAVFVSAASTGGDSGGDDEAIATSDDGGSDDDDGAEASADEESGDDEAESSGGSEADDVESVAVVPGAFEDAAVQTVVTNNSSETSNYFIEWVSKNAEGVQTGDGTSLISDVAPGVTAEYTDVLALNVGIDDTVEIVDMDRTSANQDADELAEVVLGDVTFNEIGADVSLTVTNNSSGRSNYLFNIGLFDANGVRYSTWPGSVDNVEAGGTATPVVPMLATSEDQERFSEARVISVERTAST